ncbi:MAG: imidazole glycerol phosphate synthase subunit HisH [Armatimonadetes bacterium]|nr:imidazole glycerol phosphate synthase subunit HisH [Armatimonadota bacterium]
MIAIVDYELGNLGSVEKALLRVGCDARLTQDPQAILAADGIVVPGVGAFGDCMRSLTRFGLADVIREGIAAGKPFLGICLGLQVLFEESEESPGVPGLGVFAGKVQLFRHDLKIPQIGWNQIAIRGGPPPHLAGMPDGSYVYFVHSYHVVPADESIIATTTDYGYEFASSVWRDNVFACQFHPEKSQHVGLQILDNFRLEVARRAGGVS